MDPIFLGIAMASKNVHIVTHIGTAEVPNDPTGAVAGGISDAALVLSDKYGTNIRQGNNFRLIGYGLQFKVPGQDTGAAATCSLTFCEPNRHMVKAWNLMFSQWKKQKQIEARVGRSVRYDDFELALNSGHVTNRTSHIYDNALTAADGDPHNIGLAGDSDDGGNYTSISDVYNSRFPILPESATHYDGAIKAPKFGTQYIDQNSDIYTTLICGGAASGMVDEGTLGVDMLGAGINLGEINWLPADNHINVMCGLVDYQIRYYPEDTAVQYADDLIWQLTLVYEGWSPLADSKKKRGKK